MKEELKSKQKKRKSKSKNTNHQKEKEQENSSGTDTLESSSLKYIVLETPDGVPREVKSSTKTKPDQGELKPKPNHKEGEDTSVLFVTRAEA